MAIHRKFAIPMACLVFGVIGLALGATNRRDGKLGSFVFGLGVIFAYYIPLNLGPALAKGHLMAPWLAVWLPNIILSGGRRRTVLLALAQLGSGVPVLDAGVAAAEAAVRAVSPRLETAYEPPSDRGFARHLPRPGILDRYVAAMYARVFALCALGLLGLFYVSTFIDRSDKVFKGAATWGMLGAYFWYIAPQYVYYVLPMSVLLATLVTIGVLTKNSELIVMKACGISLYRMAVPMVAGALLAGGTLFALEQTTLGPSNRKADAIRVVMNGGSPQSLDLLNRRWVVGSRGDIYNYNYFDPKNNALMGVSIYQFSDGMRSLVRRSYAERAKYAGSPGEPNAWRAEQTWTREFTPSGDTRRFSTGPIADLALEPPSYFGTQEPEPEFMSYSQLRDYIGQLRTSGFDVIAQQVALERKGLVSVRHADHDAHRGSVRGDDGPPRRDVRDWRRDRAGDHLLGGVQRLCRARHGRRRRAGARRVGAKPPLRRRRRVSAADGANLEGLAAGGGV